MRIAFFDAFLQSGAVCMRAGSAPAVRGGGPAGLARCHWCTAERSPGYTWSVARDDGARDRMTGADLVQMGGVAEMFLIDVDTLSIEQDNIPDGGRSDVPERESGEVELPLANAMYQLDA